jgi:hypothetical protein
MSGLRRRAEPSNVDQQLSAWSKRRVLSWSLFGVAGLVAVQHLLAHAGFRPLPLSMGWQDVLVGYPTALGLAVIGAIMLDPIPRI